MQRDRRRLRNPRYLTVEEAAEIVGITPGAIRYNLRMGYLRGFRIDRRGTWGILRSDLKDFVEAYYEDEDYD